MSQESLGQTEGFVLYMYLRAYTRLKVEEKVGLVNEEELQSRGPQVISSQQNFSELVYRPLKVTRQVLCKRTS